MAVVIPHSIVVFLVHITKSESLAMSQVVW